MAEKRKKVWMKYGRRVRISLLLSFLSLLFTGCSGVPIRLTGDQALARKVGFDYFVRDGHLVARIRRPRGIARATIRARMYQGDTLLLDVPAATVPVLSRAEGAGRPQLKLIDEELPQGTTRIEIELVSVDRREDLP